MYDPRRYVTVSGKVPPQAVTSRYVGRNEKSDTGLQISRTTRPESGIPSDGGRCRLRTGWSGTGFRGVIAGVSVRNHVSNFGVLTFPYSCQPRKIAKNQAIILVFWEIMRIFARFVPRVCVCEGAVGQVRNVPESGDQRSGRKTERRCKPLKAKMLFNNFIF